ncbi:MAG TPA: UDP-N-acetylmuramoyl-L-alanine--D-glutamate ligase [Longimicrobiales bacterium]|nr:UDP-N-acetylmuramoyl-L-alanine--D-glutamate ligase [Longimicrobiales bacterium]
MRVGIIGLARSGRSAARLARARGHDVFASDAGVSEEVQDAAAEVRALGGSAETGGHTVTQLAACDVLVLSPGVPRSARILADPALARVPRISELEFAFRELSAPVLAITGTNGKSTTTALTAHLLETAGFDAPAAGNIGTALSDVALRPQQPDWVVVEASSFQLADIDTFAPRIGVLTNLAPDHLDRYPSVDAYYADKARLFRNATRTSVWVLNAEDAAAMQLPGEADGRRRVFRVNTSLGVDEEGGWIDGGGNLCLRIASTETKLLHQTELRVLGAHNRANALAAAVAAVSAGASTDAIAAGLRTFGGLEHRLEVVSDTGGVLWVNDSKATNIASTVVALRSMDRPVILLLGGRHKGEPYTQLLDAMQGRVTKVIAYGEAAAIVAADLAGHAAVDRVDGSFADVVARAAAVARSGDAVLLSPACASFDMFRDYEERGRAFKTLVHDLAEAAS